MLTKPINRLNSIYREYPSKFWMVVGVSFVDGIGGRMLFPFFSLYITQRFGVGMTQAGIILGIFSFFGIIGGIIGGVLTDRFGRRKPIIFGLVASAGSMLTLGFVDEFWMLFPLAVIIGLLSDVAGPAHQAMIADILPEKQRAEGFGVMRVVGNLTWIIGPTIGGFVATRSYLALFIADAVISCIVAVLFYFLISETKPESTAEEASESFLSTFRGYGQVLRDYAFVAFIAATMLMGVVYLQMYNSLSVFLRDNHGVNEQGYGFLMTTSAITVILLQFWVTRRIKHSPPFLMMAFGTVFYMVGFSMFGFVDAYWLFVSAIVVITFGEMIVVPVSQALAANFAPQALRGRYMAMFSLTWMIPATIGPGAAGVILDNYNPNLLWFLGGILCAISVLAYLALNQRLGSKQRFAPAPVEEPV
ncbi:MAG: MFS transporter [Caldilineales bacterium]|nr:MFS transporter [Caldilineales bacterium]